MGWARVKAGLRVLSVSEPENKLNKDQVGKAGLALIATPRTKCNLHLTPDENANRPDSIL